ncbi:hypothetical protein ABK040_011332 [Willaertia magna]
MGNSKTKQQEEIKPPIIVRKETQVRDQRITIESSSNGNNGTTSTKTDGTGELLFLLKLLMEVNSTNIEKSIIYKGKNYVLTKKLGNGAFGDVYKAIREEDNELYAIKIVQFDSALESKVLKEVALATSVDHPNIVKVYDHDVQQQDPRDGRVVNSTKFLIIRMELCNGSLNDILEHIQENKVKFTLGTAIKWFIKMLNVMEELDKKRVIHRDLKPQNILVKFDPEKLSQSSTELDNIDIKIGDFGVGIQLEKSQMFTKTIAGTLIYQAPEVFENNYTSTVDIYSLGIIFMQVCAGMTEKTYAQFFAEALEKQIGLVNQFAVGLMLQDEKKLKHFHEICYKLVKDNGCLILIKKMVCKKEDRLTATQLLNHPIVLVWKKLIFNEKIDVETLGNNCIPGVLTSVQSLSQPKIVLKSLYYLDCLLNSKDENLIIEAANIFIRCNGIEIVVIFIKELFKNHLIHTDNSKEEEKQKTLLLTSIMTNSSYVNNELAQGWFYCFKILANAVKHCSLPCHIMRENAMTLRKTGFNELLKGISNINASDKLEMEVYIYFLRTLTYIAKYNITIRNQYSSPEFIKSIVKRSKLLPVDAIRLLSYVIPYIENNEFLHDILFSLPIEIIACIIDELYPNKAEMIGPTLVVRLEESLERHSLKDSRESKEKVILANKCLEKLRLESPHLKRSYYGLCSNVDRADKYYNVWHFHCETCFKDNPGFGCCLECAFHCHKGHSLKLQFPNDGFFCDCHQVKGSKCKCKKEEAELLPYLKKVNLANSNIDWVSDGLVVVTDKTLFNLLDSSCACFTKAPVRTINVSQSKDTDEETIAYCEMYVIAGGKSDDITFGVFASKKESKVDITNSNRISFNCQTGDVIVTINKKELIMPYGHPIGSTEKISLGVTNKGNVYFMINSYCLPLLTDYSLFRGFSHEECIDLHFFIGLQHVSAVSLSYDFPKLNMEDSITLEMKKEEDVCKNEMKTENNSLKNVEHDNLVNNEDKKENVSSTTPNVIKPSYSDSPSIPSGVIRNNSLGGYGDIKVIVKTYQKREKKGGTYIVLSPNNTSQEILEKVNNKLKTNNVIAIRSAENEAKVEEFEEFESEKVYWGLNEAEESEYN